MNKLMPIFLQVILVSSLYADNANPNFNNKQQQPSLIETARKIGFEVGASQGFKYGLGDAMTVFFCSLINKGDAKAVRHALVLQQLEKNLGDVELSEDIIKIAQNASDTTVWIAWAGMVGALYAGSFFMSKAMDSKK